MLVRLALVYRGTGCVNCARPDLWGAWSGNRWAYPEDSAVLVGPLLTGVPRNRMRELRTSGSVGGLVGQPLGLPGAFFGLLWSWRRPHAVPRSKKHTCGYF